MIESPAWLTRVAISREASAASLWAALMPANDSQRVKSSHHLLWSLFADSPERTRDFLWREERPGSFLVLSRRRPIDTHNLFTVSEPKEFAPVLRQGDPLRFALRVNATVSRGGGPGVRGKPADIVMNALREIPKAERAASRRLVVDRVARDWVDARSAASGFVLDQLDVKSYDTVTVDRGPKARPAKFGVLDLEGTLSIVDAATFIAAIHGGFGRAKSFGYGLMLIRRA